jgi:hypothetical protein
MNRDIAMERARPGDFRSVEREPSASSQSERKLAFFLSRSEALIFVLLLSFGLWAAIWGGVACWLWEGW